MFLYEMHQHTAACSRCGHGDVRKTVRVLKEDGFSGMVLTEHFFHGNTAIERSLPWKEFVAHYENAYLEAKDEGDKIGFDVFFGIEEGIGINGKEVLIYGITPQLLYDHPELKGRIRSIDYLKILSEIVHSAGGMLFQAHPFRERDYIKNPSEEINMSLIDGVEGYNSCNSIEENRRAKGLAEKYNLPMIAGSDSHTEDFPGRFGIETDKRIVSSEMLVSVLKSHSYKLFVPKDKR